jgi:hypothetical protein
VQKQQPNSCFLWSRGVAFLPFHFMQTGKHFHCLYSILVLLVMMLLDSHNCPWQCSHRTYLAVIAVILNNHTRCGYWNKKWDDLRGNQFANFVWYVTGVLWNMLASAGKSCSLISLGEWTACHHEFPYWITGLVHFQRWQQVWCGDPFQNIMSPGLRFCSAILFNLHSHVVRCWRPHACTRVSSQI